MTSSFVAPQQDAPALLQDTTMIQPPPPLKRQRRLSCPSASSLGLSMMLASPMIHDHVTTITSADTATLYVSPMETISRRTEDTSNTDDAAWIRPAAARRHSLQSSMDYSSNAAKQALLTEEERRANHVASEHKRRQSIKTGFERLHSLVPELSHPHGKSKSEAVVLQKTVEFIHTRLKQIHDLQEQVRLMERS